MGRRLFILPDSPYSDIIIQKCEEVALGQNVYICISRQPSLKYLKDPKCLLVSYHPLSGFTNIGKIGNLLFDGIYINLNGLLTAHFYQKILRHASPGARLICMFWSAEVYNHPSYTGQVYDEFAFEFLKDRRKLLSISLVDSLMQKMALPSLSALTKLNKKFNFFCALFVEEYLLFKNLFQSDIKFVQFTLLDTSFFIKDTVPRNQNKILLGNSGSLENNHLEALDILNTLDLSDQIICPLNYGNSEYSGAIVERGKRWFGDNFQPLLDFMPMKDYYQLMSEVKVAIFNHYIQQAFGNIVSLLFSGARVYLNAMNPLLAGLSNLGFVVFDLREFARYGIQALPAEDKNKNRALVEQYLSVNTSKIYYETLMRLSDE